MAYASVEEIEADFKDIDFTTSSSVKEADVTQFITEADALINAYVGKRYSVPVAADSSTLALLKLLTRSLVANRVRGILAVKQDTNTGANQSQRAELLSVKDVLSMLKDIRDGEIALSGATELLSGGGFYSKNYAEEVEPVFEKDTKQW